MPIYPNNAKNIEIQIDEPANIVLLSSVAAFLESLSYDVLFNVEGKFTCVAKGNLSWRGGRIISFHQALMHFLRQELGRNWHSTYEFLEQSPPAFGKEEWRAIQQAIHYHNKLEKLTNG